MVINNSFNELSVFVSGSTGFVGSQLCLALNKTGKNVVKGVHSNQANNASVFIASLESPSVNWKAAFQNVSTVIHLAFHSQSQSIYQTNLDGTQRMIQAAHECGIKRFIYLSSIKAHGEESKNSSFHEDQQPTPEDEYGKTKHAIENLIKNELKGSATEYVILRIPLVYGPGVGGNFLSLMNLIHHGIPLPFAAIKNKRSLIYLDNLVDLIVLCMSHPKAANELFFASDGIDVSLPDLVHMIANSMNRKCRLFSFPPHLLELVANMMGKKDTIRKLTRSLRVNTNKLHNQLDWHPTVSMLTGIQRTCAWYLVENSKHVSKSP